MIVSVENGSGRKDSMSRELLFQASYEITEKVEEVLRLSIEVKIK